MRHILGGVATVVIGALLIIGAVLYAAMRSSQLVISDEATVLARFAPAPPHGLEWASLGAGSYERNCRTCHSRDGTGWDQYPGLTDAATLHAAPGGRAYFVALHLYGQTSDRWRAPMPPMGHIQDVELAAVMDHVLTHFGNNVPADALYAPEDVALMRREPLSPADVNRLRPR